MREIESLNACFQSVMKASYVMKAARHACTHNHSCILLGYGLLLLLWFIIGIGGGGGGGGGPTSSFLTEDGQILYTLK